MLSALRGIKNRLISLAPANRVQPRVPFSHSFSFLYSSAFWTCLLVALLCKCYAFQSVRPSDCTSICLVVVSCLSRLKELSHNKPRYEASSFLDTGLQAFPCNLLQFRESAVKTKRFSNVHLTFRVMHKKNQFLKLSYFHLLSLTLLKPCMRKQNRLTELT